MVILDTNIIIDHLRREKQESHYIRLIKNIPQEDLAISILSIQELYQGLSTRDSKNEEILLAILSPLTILSYTYDIAQLAGKIARDLNRTIEFPDTAIAATAIVNGCQLYTLNKKDFHSIKKLDLI